MVVEFDLGDCGTVTLDSETIHHKVHFRAAGRVFECVDKITFFKVVKLMPQRYYCHHLLKLLRRVVEGSIYFKLTHAIVKRSH